MGADSITRRAPAVDKILSDIREKIFLGYFASGQPLPESMLADMYGVSRGSVRSAIQALENEGLIVVGSNGRKTPVKITKKFTHDLYETRIMLETQAMKICMEDDSFDSSLLGSALADLYSLYSCADADLYALRGRLNTAFHSALVRSANNVSLLKCWETLEPLLISISNFNYIKLADEQTNEHIINSHKKIVDMMLHHDERVFDVLRQHIADAHGETDWGFGDEDEEQSAV